MFPALFFIISLLALIIATSSDLRRRIIANKLTYSLIFLGIILHLIYSITINNPNIFFICIAVTVSTFIASYLLWKLGVWAGGDVKLITAIAALNPINYAILRDFVGFKILLFNSFDYSLPIFPLTLFIFSLFSMLPYVVLISLNGLIRNKELGRELNSLLKKRAGQLIKLSGAIVGLSSLLLFLSLPAILILPIIILLAFLGESIQLVIIILPAIFALIMAPVESITNFVFIFAPLFVLYFLIKLFLLSKDKILKNEIKITEMEEGMIVAETIVEENGKITRLEGFKIGKIINYFRNNNVEALTGMLRPKGKILANSRSAAGITEEQLRTLKELALKKKIEDRIKIKLSSAFVPAVLIAYIVLQFVGDLIWNLVF